MTFVYSIARPEPASFEHSSYGILAVTYDCGALQVRQGISAFGVVGVQQYARCNDLFPFHPCFATRGRREEYEVVEKHQELPPLILG
ncbi:hypothetical protein [Burkholderia pseudomallei]|uniref:hypothetical protein n=1 Tax=Burkholderia pseudomallei TaxID=28450 RepID=UPI00057221E2|nr:hypothetical protein AQ857_03085 [Burkholderia pseudomallei]OMZ22016.1 hypothetical protein AQ858_25725 [Burkholderia pseudomallei]